MNDLAQYIPAHKFELVSDVAAGAAVVSPWWLPLLKETSEIAGMMLPILGALWLVVQITLKLHGYFKHR